MTNFLPNILLFLLILMQPISMHTGDRGRKSGDDSEMSAGLEKDTLVSKLPVQGGRKIPNPENEKKVKEEEKFKTAQTREVEILSDRCKKSFELIKFLYEKVLGLDHLFESTQTQHDIQKLSNPHSYAAFQEIDQLMEKRMKKKHDFELPVPLQNNLYVASTFSLLKAMIGSGKNEDKQKEFEKIACILDFTLRMNNDLKLISFETEYLKDENQALKKECETLFSDCAKVIKYNRSLEQCRSADDWASLYKLLDKSLDEINRSIIRKQSDPSIVEERIIELEFSLHRVVDFINKYSAFAAETNRFYYKFDKILANYVNEAICLEELPASYIKLKETIANTSKKFNNTYELSEIKGSQLKALLFGSL